ncbi:lachrymatory-factor synthase-like [Bidens hawaiensis]|uniref:lachrymatory-factor synthase-like n=1 Tax=Bidens hawaiensis TaxID=980011 RepID=UPI004049CBBD
MAEETKNSKWEGKATAELKTTKADQVWPLLEDFCNIHKWLPTLDTCHYVQGVHGQPGLVRYCATIIKSSSSPSNEVDVKWCHEKLVSLDPVERCLRYEIGENNLGFTGYVAEMKVVEMDVGCMVEWRFVADPMEGMGLEDLCCYMESSLKAMAERMEKELQGATATS